MTWSDNFYSRFVAWMKIILPLAALGLLSTLFMISRSVDLTDPVPVSQIDLEQRAHELGVTNPSFAGVTSGGDQVTFQARRARPDTDDPQRLLAEEVMAQLRLTSGVIIDITSDNADMHQLDATATLDGNVHVTTSNGYVANTAILVTRFDLLFAESAGAVWGNGPVGELTAGRMRLSTDDLTGDAYLLFTEGVKLVYKPGETKE